MNTKAAKIPEITNQTKLLCFDLETNGLHGQAFAIGALVIDKHGTVHDQFTARTELNDEVDEWVRQHVLPVLDDMPITHGSYEAMREAFWRWFLKAEAKSDYVIVSNGYPVEYRFLLDCQEANIDERYWQHPFPLIELSSLLLPLGQLSRVKKNELYKKLPNMDDFKKHHPLDDAKATALLAFEAFKVAGLIEP